MTSRSQSEFFNPWAAQKQLGGGYWSAHLHDLHIVRVATRLPEKWLWVSDCSVPGNKRLSGSHAEILDPAACVIYRVLGGCSAGTGVSVREEQQIRNGRFPIQGHLGCGNIPFIASPYSIYEVCRRNKPKHQNCVNFVRDIGLPSDHICHCSYARNVFHSACQWTPQKAQPGPQPGG